MSDSSQSHGLQPTRLLRPWDFPGKSTGVGATASSDVEYYSVYVQMASLVAQWYRIRLPMQEMQETQVQSLDWENALEEGVAPHSSTLAWKIPWMEAPGRLQSMGLRRVGHD